MGAALFSGAVLLSASVQAEVVVENAWVRATVEGQQATGAFMDLTSKKGGKLVEAKSDIAKTVEIHEMAMENDVMKMRQIESLDLPENSKVALKPGGYHIMFIDLLERVKENDEIAMQLFVVNTDGSQETIDVKAIAKPLNSVAKASMNGHQHEAHPQEQHQHEAHSPEQHPHKH
ncbi:MAG: copper chaperone PCu(A)C [Alcaligenaceae bacterium]|nr:copper chaperone PCu(A)C [Alcaligenaceae bacterium]